MTETVGIFTASMLIGAAFGAGICAGVIMMLRLQFDAINPEKSSNSTN